MAKMERCECCGNEYDQPIYVTIANKQHTFDSFECAVHTLAPKCEHCGVSIIGHGVENNNAVFCCAHCARAVGEQGVRDRYPDANQLFGS